MITAWRRGPSGSPSSAASLWECSSMARMSDLEDFGALLERLRFGRETLRGRAHLLHSDKVLPGDQGNRLHRLDHHLTTPLLLAYRLRHLMGQLIHLLG